MDENCRVDTAYPTREIIIQSMEWLVEDAKPGDSLLLYYSGHGNLVEDTGKDEGIGYDQVACLMQRTQAIISSDGKNIVDDKLFEILVSPLQLGIAATARRY
ncbi:Ca(2+)-dependent cysteine protease [Nowakowskiella sp. JEL0407]|nr:Ca(2+)-dependent cysteine protease [Nowakowskiella sp. JEL0407]